MKLLSLCLVILLFIGCYPVDHLRVYELMLQASEIPYAASMDIIKTPVQTLADNEGDCGDLSGLLASWMIAEGLRPLEFVIWDGEDSRAYHANIRYFGVIYDPVFVVWKQDWVEVNSYRWIDLQIMWFNQD